MTKEDELIQAIQKCDEANQIMIERMEHAKDMIEKQKGLIEELRREKIELSLKIQQLTEDLETRDHTIHQLETKIGQVKRANSNLKKRLIKAESDLREQQEMLNNPNYRSKDRSAAVNEQPGKDNLDMGHHYEPKDQKGHIRTESPKYSIEQGRFFLPKRSKLSISAIKHRF